MSTVAKKIMMGSGAVDAYEIEQSLIFDDASGLVRTPSSASNRKTWTWSGWVKRSETNGSDIFSLFSADGSSDNSYINFYLDDLYILDYDYDGGGSKWFLITNRVFRDFSAWYHIVFAVDTTQSTASNRLKLYVNGVQETSFSTETYPAQNYDGFVNSTYEHHVGTAFTSASTYNLDGQLAEVHFIDGTALAASSFGETNEDTGQWIPKEYTGGSYGTNGFYLPFKDNESFSVVFDGSGDGLSSPASNDFDLGTGDWTVEFFIKAPDQSNKFIVSFRSDSNDLHITTGGYQSTSGVLRVSFGGSNHVSSTVVCNNTWKHCAITRSSNTVRMYVNGSLETTATNSTNMSAGAMAFATNGIGGGNNFTGNLSNFRMLKGTALYTGSSFTVPASSLTAITNTVVLALQSNTLIDNSSSQHVLTAAGNTSVSNDFPSQFTSSTGIGTDSSGQGNNYTPTNLLNSDVVIDSPTNNFATWNPLVPSTNTFSKGNLKATMSGSSGAKIVSTIGATTGKYYMELLWQNQSNWPVGLTSTNKREASLSGIADGSTSIGFWISSSSTVLYINTSVTSWSGSGTGWSNNDMVGLAVDGVNRTISIYKNGSSIGSYDYSGLGWKQTFFAAGNYVNNNTYLANFGQNPTHSGATSAGSATDGNGIGLFKNAPPSGFLALCTANLPEPAIPLPSAHFNTVLYTGNGGTKTVSGVGFQPGFTWIKNRPAADFHVLTDSNRGVTKTLSSNYGNSTGQSGVSTGYEQTYSNGLTAFNSDGFVVGSQEEFNTNNENFVSWNWKTGSNASNTDGDYTTSVSVNNTAGFSVMTYTGYGYPAGGQGSYEFGHGLSTAPSLVMIKKRGGGASGASGPDKGGHWVVAATAIDPNWTGYFSLNRNVAYFNGDGSGINYFWNGAPTSSVIDMKYDWFTNGSSATYVAYSWHEVAGFSKFGSYTGNGNADGPFISTGFKPAWVMIKRTDAVSSWSIYDSKRSISNVSDNLVWADLASAEGTSTQYSVDILSNGFKLRDGNSNSQNINNGVFFYMAFAESPFKTANAR